ncbi:MAG: type IV secretory system conjugative DNA transfer family protein [Nitrospira sp.]|nr:type IV secretory system conjugative DNA transfer family protein [Nitrospira sp.]
MYVPPQRQESLLLMVVFAGLFGWGAWKSLELQALPFIPYVLGFVALAIGFQALSLSLIRLRNILMRRDAMAATTQRGSASWATSKDLKRAGLYNTSGVFLGCDTDGRPLFFDGEIHGLTLAPAGSGKTIAFSVPALCHSSLPIIVSDFKGTLAVMTKPLREKQHHQKVFCVNPAHLYTEHLGAPARYNPLQILLDDWMDSEKNKDLIADAQSIALQLCPEPAATGENTFFRNGSRKILVLVFIYLIAFHGAGKATLSEALRLLRNVKELIEVCEVAMFSPILNGELADMATELHYKLTAQDTRQVDSFLEGAVQALAAFSASGWLAESTSTCDFRFKDLKECPATVYLIADPTKMKVFAPWMGLMGWAAITELTRCQNTKPVFFLLDEATNFRIENLSNSLTGLREFGIRVWFVIQELEEYARVYGRESLETLLSQTEAKQIFGASGAKSCELFSRMLGEQTVKAVNVNLGRTRYDPVIQSVSEQARRLLAPNELRQFTDTILFIRNLPPIHAIKVKYSEVNPWSDWVAANPLFGSKLEGKTRVRLKY